MKKKLKNLAKDTAAAALLLLPTIGVLWFGLDMHLPVHAAEVNHIRNGLSQEWVEELSYYFSAEEEDALLGVAQAEAGNQGVIGQALVMRVVLNRTEDVRFPDSVMGVISEPGQFTTWTNGAIEGAVPTADTESALDLICTGWDESGGALYFDSNGVGFDWAEHLFDYGAHHFYYH